MDSVQMVVIQAFAFLLWAIAMVFWLFRKGVEPLWKLASLLVFVFYVYYRWEPLLRAWQRLRQDYVVFMVDTFYYLGKAVFHLLPLIWTLVMVIVFYLIDEAKAEKLVKVFFFLTLIVWLFWGVNYFWGDFLGPWLRQEIPKFFP